jgi:hypothetical protein
MKDETSPYPSPFGGEGRATSYVILNPPPLIPPPREREKLQVHAILAKARIGENVKIPYIPSPLGGGMSRSDREGDTEFMKIA